MIEAFPISFGAFLLMDPLQFPGGPTTEWSVLQPFSNCPYSCLFRSTWSPDRPATEWLVLQSFSDHIYAGIGCPQRKNPSRISLLSRHSKRGHLFVNILHPCWDETEAFAFASFFYTQLGWEQLGEQLGCRHGSGEFLLEFLLGWSGHTTCKYNCLVPPFLLAPTTPPDIFIKGEGLFV